MARRSAIFFSTSSFFLRGEGARLRAVLACRKVEQQFPALERL
jgi:hypothetical protein